jgi:hypothetical protein
VRIVIPWIVEDGNSVKNENSVPEVPRNGGEDLDVFSRALV